MALNLTDWGMHEIDGVLIQDLKDGTAMQVKLAADLIDVRQRCVPVATMNDVSTDTPAWSTAYELMVSVWLHNDSPVWQWLKQRGISEVAVYRRLLGLSKG